MPKKILVVDDEELLTRSFSNLLEKHGYEVYTVRNGTDAVVMIEEEDFDLIITDIRMPGDDGVVTIGKVQEALEKKRKSKIPVIFITGYADARLEKEARKLNPVAYLFKPFDVKQILELVTATINT